MPKYVDLKIGDVVGTRQIIDIIYEPIAKKKGKIGRVYVTKCLRCGNIFKDTMVNRLCTTKCENCKWSIEWNGQLFLSKTDMAKKLGVSRHSLTVWARLHNDDFSEYTVEWSKEQSKYKFSHSLKYKIGDIINNQEIIDHTYIKKKHVYITKCIHCGKIIKKSAGRLATYVCSCLKTKKYNIGDIVNGRELVGKANANLYFWKCIDCGKIVEGHISYAERSQCLCKHASVLSEKQINRSIPSRLRKNDLPKNIHYKLPTKKDKRFWFCARVQARYNGIRKGFEYDSQDINTCIAALPDLKKLALHYSKTGEHITYKQYINMGCPELKVD